MPTRPSMLPIAYPVASGKHATTLVWYLSEDTVLYSSGISQSVRARTSPLAALHLGRDIGFPEIKHVDITISASDDHEWIDDVH
jgi:hypothetical protein